MENKEFDLTEMILKFGNSLTLSGILFTDINNSILLMLPDNKKPSDISIPEISLEDWKKIFNQLDILEVEVLSNDEHGLKKAILRKSARQIEGRITWNVFRRDSYTCRYCGKSDVPLTVDHLVLWEEGGPSIEENLVTACSKCNKARGNMQYSDWIKSDFYLNVCKNVSPITQILNKSIVDSLPSIPRRVHIPSRGSNKRRRD